MFIVLADLGWQLFFKQRIAKNYNVILISIDTCRADFIGAYGNSAISTPNLDSLAKEGILFEHFYSSINTTLPSHASLLTGLYPRNHGVARNAMRLGAQNQTLTEFLKSQGYSTAAFIGSFALASVFGLNQGFDVYDESFMGDPSKYIGRSLVINMKDGKTLEALEPDTRTGDIMRPAEDVKASFEKWLSKNKDHKFFAFVHFYDPHFPYLPPEKWYRKHMAAIPERTPLTEQDRINFYPNFKTLVGSIENFRPAQIETVEFSPEVDALVHLYSSEIEYVDSVIGELVKDLDRADLRDQTILIVTSDHGENLVEHSRFNSFFRHGLLTFQTETKVPFLISSPGLLDAGMRVSEPASQLDVFPTLLELLGLKSTLRFDGKSLYPVLFGKDKQESPRLIFA
ncbi:sulfatase, partial [bacterium]|nr:sulfatase [bacterium]